MNIFESILHQTFPVGIALAEFGIQRTAQEGVDPSKQLNLKMRLDAFRILGLVICTKQSEDLIKVEKETSSPELIERIKRFYVNIAKVFENLTIDDKHRNTYLLHVEYQILNAGPTLERIGAIHLAKFVLEFMR